MNLLALPGQVPAARHADGDGDYRQYAYADTRGSGSYQLAYVLHPATLWKEFGPINVDVAGAQGHRLQGVGGHRNARARSRLTPGLAANDAERCRAWFRHRPRRKSIAQTSIRSRLTEPGQKSGELFVGIDKAAWDRTFPPAKPKPAPAQQAQQPSQPRRPRSTKSLPGRAAVRPAESAIVELAVHAL